MPLSSMTGFGQAELLTPSGNYRVEISSVNNRFLDFQIRTPRNYLALEPKIRKFLSSKIKRGSITLIVARSIENDKDKIAWNKDLVKSYLTILQEVKNECNISDDISLSNLLSFNGFIQEQIQEHNLDTIWKHLEPIIKKALKGLINTREKEASFLILEIKNI